ncbi:hypothetical protein FJ970_32330 (plasmid) [Mesorhizobium sp. B2-1-8]|uniref:hypothetical protein n=1 Tax=Mesorhizobium sp. B2-1-8 TaxID=2589967 RepID=UPI001D10B5A9|nr:hypothetical protein [Mesorhizobium sp. B2-1-8]UCI22624.1 hypothetical protein FJ970_32330 [Mesorhizobium sp. B2-1-8]
MERRAARLRRLRYSVEGRQDLRVLPTIKRKAILWDLVKPATGIIQYSQNVEGNGAEFYAAADKRGLEGIVSKRQSAACHSGKGDSWVKTKCWDVADLELLGIKREPAKIAEGLFAKDGSIAGKAALSVNRSIKERLWRCVEQARARHWHHRPRATSSGRIEAAPCFSARFWEKMRLAAIRACLAVMGGEKKGRETGVHRCGQGRQDSARAYLVVSKPPLRIWQS